MKTTSANILMGGILVALVAAGVYFALNNFMPTSPGDAQSVATVQSVIDIGPGLPARLVIPAINVDAKVLYVGLAADGSVDAPKGPTDVAWFRLGPRPGAQGSAIITGHFGPWRTGAKSVFDNLEQLKSGDSIFVKDDQGNSVEFKVRETKVYDSSENPKEVFNQSDGKYLNLITCNGDWIASQKTYTKRLVVFTEAVN